MGRGFGAIRGTGLALGLRLVVAAAGGLSLSACASSTLPSFTSIFGGTDKNAIPPDEPADKLYNEGLTLLEKKEYVDAAKKFEEVDRQHPYSEWGRKSLLMSAFTYYENGKYDETATAAQRYVTLHPGSPDAAYAQYLVASSYYDQIPDVTRDQARTEKALRALEEVVRKYPDTEYGETARQKIAVARDQLAGKEMMIGRYYLERRNFTGAINRFKAVVTQYQTTRHVEEALMRLTEAYMALGIVQEAQTAAAVLGHNFPDSQWYKDAYKLVQTRGLEPRESRDSWIVRAFKSVVG
jgi:outer membrane protein assembly factor BamD